MAFKDTEVRNLEAAEKPYRRADEKGLYIGVHPNGSKLWRFKYRCGGQRSGWRWGHIHKCRCPA
jgi:hypothetical protein